MTHQEFSRDRFILSNDRSRLSLDTVCGFLERSYWASKRPRERVVKSIENSLCYGIYSDEKQVAFARVVTDYSTYAYLCDVFVDENYRGIGLSKWMMECLMQNPDLSELRRFTLATKDAHGLYAQFGFKPITGEETRRLMTILKDGI